MSVWWVPAIPAFPRRLELAQAGYKVVVLEAERVGYGASGRNGGQICTGFSSGQGKIEAQLGRDDARKCFALAEEVKGSAEAADRPAQDRLRSQMGLSAHNPQGRINSANCRSGRKSGTGSVIPIRVFSARPNWTRSSAPASITARLREGGAGHFHPLNYCLGLARAAIKAGATIYEGSRVTEVDTGSKPFARTAEGKVEAKFMVIAGNAYLGRTVPKLYGRVMPVGSYIIATEPLGENRAKALIRDGEAVANTKFIVDYFRLTGDNRMLFGGRASYSTLEPSNLGAYMRPRMTAVFPQLADVRIDYAWGGFIAITYNRIPDCGRLSPTVYYAHGYSGQGVALAGIYGKLMAEAIRGSGRTFRSSRPHQAPALPGRRPAHAHAGGGDAVFPNSRRVELIVYVFSCCSRPNAPG